MFIYFLTRCLKTARLLQSIMAAAYALLFQVKLPKEGHPGSRAQEMSKIADLLIQRQKILSARVSEKAPCQ